MNATGILHTYLNTHNNDELQRTDILVMLKRITDEHQAAISTAVQSEREAQNNALELIEKYVDMFDNDRLSNLAVKNWIDDEWLPEVRAAIRARSEAK